MRLHIEFSPSHQLAATLIAAHAVVMSLVLPLFPAWAAWLLAAVLLFSLLHYLLRDAWLRLPGSFTGLVLEEEELVLIRRDGAHLSCRIMPGSLVMPGLTVLNVRPEGRRLARSLAILPDSLGLDAFRQLRVCLKWGSYLPAGPNPDLPA